MQWQNVDIGTSFRVVSTSGQQVFVVATLLTFETWCYIYKGLIEIYGHVMEQKSVAKYATSKQK